MGRIKKLVIMHNDLNPKDPVPPLEDLLELYRITGDRTGLTDEQMREVSEDE